MTGGGQVAQLLQADPNAVVGAARDIFGGVGAAERAVDNTQGAASSGRTWTGQSGSAFSDAASDQGRASQGYAQDGRVATTAVTRYADVLHRSQQSVAAGMPAVNRVAPMYDWARTNLSRPMSPANRQYVVDTYNAAYTQGFSAQRDLVNPAITGVLKASTDLRDSLGSLLQKAGSEMSGWFDQRVRSGPLPSATTTVSGIVKSQDPETGVWTAKTPSGDVLWTARLQRAGDASSRWAIRATPEGLDKMRQELEANKDVWAQAKNSNSEKLLGALGIPAGGAVKYGADSVVDKAQRTAKETKLEMQKTREGLDAELERVERTADQTERAQRAAEAEVKNAKGLPRLRDIWRNGVKEAELKLRSAEAANEAAKLQRSQYRIDIDRKRFEIDFGKKDRRGGPGRIKGTGVKGGLNALETAIEGGGSRVAPNATRISKGAGWGTALLGVGAAGVAASNQSIDDSTTNITTLQKQLEDSSKTIAEARKTSKVEAGDFSRKTPHTATLSGASFAVDLPNTRELETPRNPIDSFRDPAVKVFGPLFHGGKDGSSNPVLVQPGREGGLPTSRPLDLIKGYQPDLHPDRKTTSPTPPPTR